jgi:transposase-like protein
MEIIGRRHAACELPTRWRWPPRRSASVDGATPDQIPWTWSTSSMLECARFSGHRLSDEKENPLSIVEPAAIVSEGGVQDGHANSLRSEDSRRRRRLSHDEALEIARLYGATSTPTSEIRERFGIGDSSLYRIVQRQGIALRGRTASSTQPNTQRAQTPAARRPRSSSPKQAQKAVSQPAPTRRHVPRT